MKITLTNGGHTLIDDADAPRVTPHQWASVTKRNKTYAHARIKGRNGKWRRVFLHRWLEGEPVGKLVDHQNGDGLDNQRSTNLRVCTRSQNMGNAKKHSDRAGKYKGVYQEAGGKYVAQICINRKRFKLGRFDKAEDAARAYDAKAFEMWGEFFKGNFPPQSALEALT
jgi:hypothetical protein